MSYPCLLTFSPLCDWKGSGNPGLTLFWTCVHLSNPFSFWFPPIPARRTFPCWLPSGRASWEGCSVQILPIGQGQEIDPSNPLDQRTNWFSYWTTSLENPPSPECLPFFHVCFSLTTLLATAMQFCAHLRYPFLPGGKGEGFKESSNYVDT